LVNDKYETLRKAVAQLFSRFLKELRKISKVRTKDNSLVAKVFNTRNSRSVRNTATFCFRSIQPIWNEKWQLV